MKINALGGTTKVAVVSNAKLPPSCGSFEGLKVDNMPVNASCQLKPYQPAPIEALQKQEQPTSKPQMDKS
jgi:hypothetical protein